MYLRANTTVTVAMGPFLDSGDGDTEETGLTISQADVRIKKNGGNFAQKADTSSLTHDELGFYDCVLDGADVDTLGRLLVAIHESGALIAWRSFQVMPEWWYDINVLGLGVKAGTLSAVTDADSMALATGDIISNDQINGSMLWIYDGTGAGQSPRIIIDSAAAGDTVELDPAFGTTPDTTSKYIVLQGPPAPSAANAPPANMVAVSGDALAADNIEADYDGTGYTKTNSVVGTVNVLNDSVDVESISGDSAAADALEALLDGTGLTEPTAPPSFSTATVQAVLAWLLALSRNEINQTGSTTTLRNDADSADIATWSVSDDGTTFTSAEGS